MARARLLKPGFFTNTALASVPPIGRILFQGLWCLADREGRLEDDARRIQAQVLPYDRANVNVLLNQLADLRFIVRYADGGDRFIQIVNFKKHQSPHVREPASTIPPPGLARGEHRASTGLASAETGTSPAVTGNGSGSGNPIPETVAETESSSGAAPATAGRDDDEFPVHRLARELRDTGLSRLPPKFARDPEQFDAYQEFGRDYAEQFPDEAPQLLADALDNFRRAEPGKLPFPSSVRRYMPPLPPRRTAEAEAEPTPLFAAPDIALHKRVMAEMRRMYGAEWVDEQDAPAALPEYAAIRERLSGAVGAAR